MDSNWGKMKKLISVLACTALLVAGGALPSQAKDIKGSGTVKIGKTYKPGVYVSANSNSAGCYWARLSGFSGKLDDILSSEFGSGQMIVEIQDGDAGFKSSRCGTWKPIKNLKLIKTLKTNGIYQVGTQIMPGTYESSSNDSCYWARLSSFGGDLEAILASDFASGPQIVTIEEGDAGFKTSRCGTWKKID